MLLLFFVLCVAFLVWPLEAKKKKQKNEKALEALERLIILHTLQRSFGSFLSCGSFIVSIIPNWSALR